MSDKTDNTSLNHLANIWCSHKHEVLLAYKMHVLSRIKVYFEPYWILNHWTWNLLQHLIYQVCLLIIWHTNFFLHVVLCILHKERWWQVCNRVSWIHRTKGKEWHYSSWTLHHVHWKGFDFDVIVIVNLASLCVCEREREKFLTISSFLVYNFQWMSSSVSCM